MEIAFELFEDLLLAEMLHGVIAGVGSELGAEGWVVDEGADGGVEGLGVFGGDYEAAGFVVSCGR